MSVIGMNDRIRLLVTSRAKKIAQKRIAKIRQAVSDATTLWRNHIKRMLSTPWPGYRQSYGANAVPYMRSGKLRNSVPRYKVTTRKTFNGSKYDLGQTVIHMQRVGAKPAWGTYGEELSTERSDGLQGWQERAYNTLANKIDEKLGFTKSYYKF